MLDTDYFNFSNGFLIVVNFRLLKISNNFPAFRDLAKDNELTV